MKSINVLTAVIFTICCCSFFSLSAQITNTWIGGSAGNESNWECYKNWSQGEVPDWSSDVVIPDVESGSGDYPVIKQGELEVNSLFIHSAASLEIESEASLVVFFHEFNDGGILNQGQLIVDGMLEYGENIISKEIVLATKIK